MFRQGGAGFRRNNLLPGGRSSRRAAEKRRGKRSPGRRRCPPAEGRSRSRRGAWLRSSPAWPRRRKAHGWVRRRHRPSPPPAASPGAGEKRRRYRRLSGRSRPAGSGQRGAGRRGRGYFPPACAPARPRGGELPRSEAANHRSSLPARPPERERYAWCLFLFSEGTDGIAAFGTAQAQSAVAQPG